MRITLALGFGFGLLACGCGGSSSNKPEEPAPLPVATKDLPVAVAEGDTFSKLQSELFDVHCTRCHNAANSNNGVILTSYQSLVQGATTDGKALVVPERSQESRVFQVLDQGIMPPKGPIDRALINRLACWIDQGAPETETFSCPAGS